MTVVQQGKLVAISALQPIVRALYRRFPIIRTMRFAAQRAIASHVAKKGSIRANLQGAVRQVSAGEDFAAVAKSIRFTNHACPRVSIIIPVYNKLEYTLTCLRSLSQHETECPFEVIIIDDNSSDSTPHDLRQIENIKVHTNDVNRGFLRNCNVGAQMARGELLVFLNNDVNVLPGWLDNLVRTIDTVENAGIVGSKLIYANGVLQEAGGIIWRDGSGMTYGRGGNPDHPRYNYMRDADYVSGASIIIAKRLFDQLHGFDETFAPAYYEDTDLCFRVREIAGKRVLYQPLSAIIHYEGISSGTDLKSGIKRHQAINQPVFLHKWKAVLETHHKQPSVASNAHDRRPSRHILVIDHRVPKPDEDSGSIDMIHILQVLATDIGRVHFYPLRDQRYIGRYFDPLEAIGIECNYDPFYARLRKFVRERSHLITDVWIARRDIAEETIDVVRKLLPNANVIFHTVDLHFVREERQRKALSDGATKVETDPAERELAIMRKADRTVVISQHEADVLAARGIDNVTVLPLVRKFEPPLARPFADRRGVLFFGGFDHLPNVDAADYLIESIWPEVRRLCHAGGTPPIKLIIAGSNMPARFSSVGSEDIEAIGYVEDPHRLFSEVRLSVAPLRYGAGLKGKVLSSVADGVPVVGTDIAFEGFPRLEEDGGMRHFQQEETAQDIASRIVALYDDEAWWTAASHSGMAYARRHFAFASARDKIAQILDFASTQVAR